MSATKIITALLKAAPDVVALTTAARIYPIKAPQDGSAPYIVMNIVGASDEAETLESAGGYPERRVSIECLADTEGGAIDLGDVVFEALRNVTKQAIAGGQDVDVRPAGFDLTDAADTESLSRRILHFYVRWRTA